MLKPGGTVIVQEPVRDSRVLSFLRRLIPYHAQHVSEFEAPLTKDRWTHSARACNRIA